MLGLGPGGGLPSDPYVFGLDAQTQHSRYVAALDAVVHLLTTSEPLSLETEGFTLHDAVLQLRPYTRPHMPLALVTGTNRDTLERIGRYGARWFVGTGPDKFDEAWGVIERSRPGSRTHGGAFRRLPSGNDAPSGDERASPGRYPSGRGAESVTTFRRPSPVRLFPTCRVRRGLSTSQRNPRASSERPRML